MAEVVHATSVERRINDCGTRNICREQAIPGMFCIWLCNGSPFPYAVKEDDAECSQWLKSTCDNSGIGDCKTVASDFVPISSWPKARCQTFMTSDPGQCP